MTSKHEILASAACEYARNGLRVLPVGRNKVPLIWKWTEKASSDADTVAAWWKQFHEANIGLATGSQPAGIGLMVVDIDVKNGKHGDSALEELQSQYGELPATLTAQTPSGGLHIYLSYPTHLSLRGGANRIGDGIDLLADGQQVLIAPSFTSAGEYSFPGQFSVSDICEAPAWIVGLLESGPNEIETGNGKADKVVGRVDVLRIRELLSWIPPRPHYGLWIRIVASVLDFTDGNKSLAEELLKEWSPEEKTGEYRAKLEYALDQVTAGTLVHIARDNGYQKGFTREFVLDCLKLDERGDAILFEKIVKDRCLFDYDNKKFMIYEDGRWHDDKLRRTEREIPELLRPQYLRVSKVLDNEIMRPTATIDNKTIGRLSKDRDAFRKRANALNKLPRIRHVSELIRRQIPCTREEFDRAGHLLNIRNGTYDLQADKFLTHDPSHRLSKRADVEYDRDATAPNWGDFIDVIFDNDSDLISFVQSVVGCLLTGLTDLDRLFFFYGTGTNGKSTFISVIKMLLGDYFRSIPIETLLSKRSNPQDQYQIAAMQGVRCCVASEVPQGRRLNESLVKDLTGGDVLSARKPFGEPFNFSPTHKIVIVGNHKPVISGTDEGIWRRLCLISFPVQIPQVDQIPRSQLLNTFRRELPGILNWAIEG